MFSFSYRHEHLHHAKWLNRIDFLPNMHTPVRAPLDDSLQLGMVETLDSHSIKLDAVRVHRQRPYHRYEPKWFRAVDCHWHDIQQRHLLNWKNQCDWLVPLRKLVLYSLHHLLLLVQLEYLKNKNRNNMINNMNWVVNKVFKGSNRRLLMLLTGWIRYKC